MSFPRYPKYKASGVAWLGEVPEGWEVKPLRSVFKFSKGLTITKENLQDEGVYCVNYGEIHSKYGFRLNPIVHPLKCVDSEYLLTNPDALIRDGDFVFADTSEDLVGSGNFTHLRSEKPIFAGYHTIIGRPRKDTNPLLLAYQFDSSAFRSQIQKQVKGVKVFSISQGILKATKCLLPPLPEQKTIAEFLDHETGKIDELVAEQRRLMELLKEKRQAVITHAVTKGLDPTAPMKPSGIDWLGDVPQSWEVKRLKHLGQAIIGLTYSPADIVYEGTGTLVLRSSNVQDGKIVINDNVYVGAAIRETLVTRVGDILICSRNGSRALIGKNAMIDETSAGLTFGAFMTIFRSLHSGYISCVLNSPLFEFQSGAFMTSTINQLTIGVLNNFEVPFPPADEREQIVKFLQTETGKFNTLIAEAQRSIDLLQERRTALISAAVTGQIDVRNKSPEN